MSVHLMLVKRGAYSGEHEGWMREHQFNNGYHKHFAREVLYTLPREDVRSNDHPYDFDWLTRPTDFDAWRETIARDPECANPNLLTLVDILEAEPDYWIYVSQ